MTEQQAVEKARRLAMERDIVLDPADLRDSLGNALLKLAQLSITAGWRILLENNYSLTISGQSASFAAQTDLLPESIKACNHITHPSVLRPGTSELLRFRILDEVADLDYAASISQTVFAFAAVGASAVEFRYSSSLTSTLTVRAVRIPKVNVSTFAIDNLPTQLDDMVIDLMVGLAGRQIAA